MAFTKSGLFLLLMVSSVKIITGNDRVLCLTNSITTFICDGNDTILFEKITFGYFLDTYCSKALNSANPNGAILHQCCKVMQNRTIMTFSRPFGNSTIITLYGSILHDCTFSHICTIYQWTAQHMNMNHTLEPIPDFVHINYNCLPEHSSAAICQTINITGNRVFIQKTSAEKGNNCSCLVYSEDCNEILQVSLVVLMLNQGSICKVQFSDNQTPNHIDCSEMDDKYFYNSSFNYLSLRFEINFTSGKELIGLKVKGLHESKLHLQCGGSVFQRITNRSPCSDLKQETKPLPRSQKTTKSGGSNLESSIKTTDLLMSATTVHYYKSLVEKTLKLQLINKPKTHSEKAAALYSVSSTPLLTKMNTQTLTSFTISSKGNKDNIRAIVGGVICGVCILVITALSIFKFCYHPNYVDPQD